MTATTTNMVWACGVCNGTNVVNDGWVDANTGEVVSTFSATRCQDCDQETALVQRPVFPEIFTWTLSLESKYHELNDVFEEVRSEKFTGTGAELEAFAVKFLGSAIIGVDDVRWNGNGAPLSSILKIELNETPESVVE